MPPRAPKITEKSILPAPKHNYTTVAIIVLVLLLCAVFGVASYFYYQLKKNNPAVTAVDEIATLTKAIGASMLLPADETPTLATVSDKEKLAGQPFFQKAENGDKVLIYAQTGRAILYRPSTKKIIEMTSVNIEQAAQAAPVPEPAPSPAPVTAPEGSETVAPVFDTPISVLNGGAAKGSADTLAAELEKNGYPQVSTGDTTKNYQGVTVYYAEGKEKEAALLKEKLVALYPDTTLAPALANETETQTSPLTVIIGK